MGRVPTLLVTLGALLAAGCAQHATRPAQGEESALQRWLDAELAPYLAEQLGRHPRFKGEPVMLVSMDGPDIQPDIDGLTRSLRDQLMDRLLAEPGVRLPWQPQQPQAQHHRRLEQANCARIRDADYYIGIEITRSTADRYRVAVRALDVRAGEWVSGFGNRWSGSLTGGEVRALQERRSDESLRGLRVLPFSSAHPDLAARYLANNLSCLLRQQDEEDLVIYVQALQSEQAGLQTLLGLIGNNLSRYHEVRVTDRKQEASFLLRGEAHRIQAGLYQVWVVLHPQNSGEHLPGMDTATYVRLPPAGGEPGPRPVAALLGSEKPAITGMELVRRLGVDEGFESCAEQGQHQFGTKKIAQGCPVLELSVARADRVFVFVHGTRDGVSRLSSASCGGGPALDTMAAHRYRFPASRFSDADWPTVYAIAVSGPELAQQFTRLLEVLPDACGSSAGMRADERDTEQWLASLDRLIATHSNHAVWTARRIP
jgi:hypothetical protein